MRIQSDFKDYYDVSQAHGVDTTFVYRRYETVKTFANYPFIAPSYHSTRVNLRYIGFCGKIYPVIVTSEWPVSSLKEYKYCYTAEEFDNYVNQRWAESDQKRYYQKLRHHKFLHFWKTTQKNIHKLFENIELDKDKHTKLFEDNYSPVFIAYREKNIWTIKFNTMLKYYEFFRIFDPYTAYQEISMWLSNQAVPMKPIPKIDDKTMVEIKGFDKFSFRKDKQ